MQQAKFSKCLCRLIATSLIITTALATNQVFADAVCTSTRCSEVATDIHRGIDNKTNPCDDFYQFACGRWLDPDNRLELLFFQSTDKRYQRLRELVEQDDPSMMKQVKNIYRSCMNLTDVESRGNRPLLDLIEDLGGWPVLMNSTAGKDYNTSWLELVAKFKEHGLSHDMLLDMSIRTSANDSQYLLSLGSPNLALHNLSLYDDEVIVSAYHKMMVDSAEILGAAREEAEAQLLLVLEFEKSLAKIYGQRHTSINEATIKYVREYLHPWNFTNYLRITLGDTPFDLANDITRIGCAGSYLHYMENLRDILPKTEPRVLANYMIWHVVRNFIMALPSKWNELQRSFRKVLRQSDEPRWKQCLSFILKPANVFSLEGTLHIGLASSYAKKHFSKRSHAAIVEIIEAVRGEYIRFLDNVTWMDDETSREAKSKARTVSYSTSHYDKLLDGCLIRSFYKDLAIKPDDFFANMRHFRRWSTKHSFNQIRKPNKKAKWTILSQALDEIAFYDGGRNHFYLPIGYIVQEPMFSIEQPNYLNFAGIGRTAGHEIAHGFDWLGRESDSNGTLKQWYRTYSASEPLEPECLRDQYSKYFDHHWQVQVDGRRTLNENISDNRAVRQTYQAYQRWTKDHGQEARLPGLNYTQDQLFWLGFAKKYCKKPPYMREDQHAPPRYRVIGPLSNSPEFAQSFNCPQGSPMNPTKKCDLW